MVKSKKAEKKDKIRVVKILHEFCIDSKVRCEGSHPFMTLEPAQINCKRLLPNQLASIQGGPKSRPLQNYH